MTHSCKTCRKKSCHGPVLKVVFAQVALVQEDLRSITIRYIQCPGGSKKRVRFWLEIWEKTRHGDRDLLHQTFQVPQMEVFTEMVSKPTPKIDL